jgi:ribosome-associated protein
MHSDPIAPSRRRGVIQTDEQALDLSRRAVDILSDRQAHNILLLDVRGVTTLADYFVIANGDSERQLRALTDTVDKLFVDERIQQLRIEGTPDSGWVLLDYGAVIIHLFSPAQRGFYNIERVWDEATPLLRIQ